MAVGNILGRKIRDIRINRSETMEEFAKIVGANKSNVSRWERGVNLPNAITLNKIAELENVTIDELLNIKAPQRTALDILVNLYQLSTAEDIIDGKTNEPITIKKYQKMIKDEVLEMSKLLGVQIEKEAPND